MQSRYAGDIGDFGKFILLKAIADAFGGGSLLGINWYRAELKEGNNDGRHIRYLDPSYKKSRLFRVCDPEVYDGLSRIISSGRRSIEALEKSRLLPHGTETFGEPVTSTDRSGWFDRSLKSLARSSVLFLDPDNGFQPRSVSDSSRSAAKYALVDEVQQLVAEGKTVICYNHRDRKPAGEYAQRLAEVSRMAESRRIRVLRFRRVSVRDYVFLFEPDKADLIQQVFETLTRPPKDFLFQELPLK